MKLYCQSGPHRDFFQDPRVCEMLHKGWNLRSSLCSYNVSVLWVLDRYL